MKDIPPSKIDYRKGYVFENAKFLFICESYNFHRGNEINNASKISLETLIFFAFLTWIADLKVLLRSAYEKDTATECYGGQFVS